MQLKSMHSTDCQCFKYLRSFAGASSTFNEVDSARMKWSSQIMQQRSTKLSLSRVHESPFPKAHMEAAKMRFVAES